MNVLQRNKALIHRHDAGESFVSIAGDFGIAKEALSNYYYAYQYIVDRPFYDIVANMDLSDQVGTKLVNALARYEGVRGITLDAEYLRTMNRNDLLNQRGVGEAVIKAFDKLQGALQDGFDG